MNAKVANVDAMVRTLPRSDQVAVVRNVVAGQSKEDQDRTLVELARELPLPTPPVNDGLWKIVVSALSAALIVAAVALSVGMFYGSAQAATKSETMLTVITTIVGFLAGLFTPNPRTAGTR